MRLHLYYKIAFTSLIFLKLELTLSYSLNNWSDFMYTTPVHVLLDPECPNHIGFTYSLMQKVSQVFYENPYIFKD